MPFQKDRDRIIHCKAFRRLKDKTQVFVPHHGDHYRNRLTHSLEVAQVSRDLARTLGLNEDLTESIALAHDLGHTPFGHAGEEALDQCLQTHGLHFEHNEQSRRIVEELEEVYPNFPGLNLSIEVIEGMMKHQTFWDNPLDGDAVRPSLEAQLVNLGDEIAYQNHDVDDGLRSGLFTEEAIFHLAMWQQAHERSLSKNGDIKDEKIRIARTVSAMISLMIQDIAEETSRRIQKHSIKTLDDVMTCPEKLVGFSGRLASANNELKDFLSTKLYYNPNVTVHTERGQGIIKKLFHSYTEKSDGAVGAYGAKNPMSPSEARDFIAGMTDHFAEEQLASLVSLEP